LKASQISYKEDEKTELDEKPLSIKIAFLDVGQADTIVISCSETHEAIVVDCVNARAVLTYLAREQIKYLRGIIITHLHADHYSEVANLLNNYHQVAGLQECEVLAFNEVFNQKNLKLLMPDADGHSSSYDQPLLDGKKLVPISLSNLFDWCKQHKLNCANLKVERRPLPFEGTLANPNRLQLLHPYFADYLDLKTKNLNNTSVVLRVVGSGVLIFVYSALKLPINVETQFFNSLDLKQTRMVIQLLVQSKVVHV